MATLRAGIIGLGRVASLLEDDPLRFKPASHAGAYDLHPDTTLVAGADIATEARERFSRRWGVTALYEDYREMLRRERLDVVSICAYATERAQMVVDAAEAGVKAIWCEKAIATNMGEARRLTEVCDYYGVQTLVNHPRRWDVNYLEVQRRIQEGEIGTPESIVAYFSGNLLHTGTHAFDVMRMLLGEVEEVQGRLDLRGLSADQVSGYRHNEDVDLGDVGGWATLRFANGTIGTVHAHAKNHFMFQFDVVGSQGALRFGNDMSTEQFRPGQSPTVSGLTILRPHPFSVTFRQKEFSPIQELVERLRLGRPGTSTLTDGAKALEIALAIHKSDQLGGASVRLPLEDLSLTVRSR